MDGFFNLGVDNGRKTVLNAGNGLTFCIEIGDKNALTDNVYISEKEEPSISLVENAIDNDSLLEPDDHKIVLELGDPEVNSQYRSTKVAKNKTSSFISHVDNRCINKPASRKQITSRKKRVHTKSGIYVFSKRKKAIGVETVSHNNNNFTHFQKKFPLVSKKLAVNKIFEDTKDSLFILRKPKVQNGNSILNSSSGSDYSCTSQNFEDSDCIERPLLHLIKDEKGEFRENPIIIESDYSKTICWEEGNIDKVTDFISLSESVVKNYSSTEVLNKDPLGIDYSQFMSNIDVYESPIDNKLVTAPGMRLYLSWEAVKNRIEQLQDQTMTRFILDYKTPTFKDDPKPFKKLYFEVSIQRKDVKNVIPNNGIPFLLLGSCIFTCHLGKKRNKKDNVEEELSNGLRSKKIGCPAIISIVRIARFPDFDVSGLNRACEEQVLKELRDNWDFKTSHIRYYIEYHMREPQPSDHKGHEVMFLVNNNRFKESIDPRILEKIRDLTRQGIFKTKIVREKVNDYIQQELFKGEQSPPLDRRKYNPSERDIRYAILKAKEELKKEGKNIMQLECSALARDLSDSLKNVTDEEYLKQVRYYLTLLLKAVRLKQPLESFFLTSSLGFNNFSPSLSSPVKKTPKIISKEEEIEIESPPSPLIEGIASAPSNTVDYLSTVPSASSGVHFSDQVIEQFYVNSSDDVVENEFNAAQIYGGQDLVDLNPSLIEGLQATGGDGVTEVYYYFTDGSCEIASPTLVNEQN